MTELQINKAKALAKCTFPVGSNQKRFAGNMAALANSKPETELTVKQSAYLDLLFHQYRRQIPKSHRRWCDCADSQAKRLQIPLAILVLVLSVLACAVPVGTPAPAPSARVSPTVKPELLPTVATKQWVAQVELPTVNVRDEPNGKVVGSLVAGDTVTIVKCVGSWCQIKPVGWIFKGCLNVDSDLGCRAK